MGLTTSQCEPNFWQKNAGNKLRSSPKIKEIEPAKRGVGKHGRGVRGGLRGPYTSAGGVRDHIQTALPLFKSLGDALEILYSKIRPIYNSLGEFFVLALINEIAKSRGKDTWGRAAPHCWIFKL